LPDWLTLPDAKPMKSCRPIRLYLVLVILTVVVGLSVRAIASLITEISHQSMNMETLKVVPPFWRMNLPPFLATKFLTVKVLAALI
jgi:hypothetical protein